MLKQKKSESHERLSYENTLRNNFQRKNIYNVNNNINRPQNTYRYSSLNNYRKIVRREQSQQITKLEENKIHMNSLCQPMILHPQNQNKRNSTLESPKFQRNCVNFIKQETIIPKHIHFLKKYGSKSQVKFVNLIKNNQKTQTFIDEPKSELKIQLFQNYVKFSTIPDFGGWQTKEESLIE